MNGTNRDLPSSFLQTRQKAGDGSGYCLLLLCFDLIDFSRQSHHLFHEKPCFPHDGAEERQNTLL